MLYFSNINRWPWPVRVLHQGGSGVGWGDGGQDFASLSCLSSVTRFCYIDDIKF